MCLNNTRISPIAIERRMRQSLRHMKYCVLYENLTEIRNGPPSRNTESLWKKKKKVLFSIESRFISRHTRQWIFISIRTMVCLFVLVYTLLFLLSTWINEWMVLASQLGTHAYASMHICSITRCCAMCVTENWAPDHNSVHLNGDDLNLLCLFAQRGTKYEHLNEFESGRSQRKTIQKEVKQEETEMWRSADAASSIFNNMMLHMVLCAFVCVVWNIIIYTFTNWTS